MCFVGKLLPWVLQTNSAAGRILAVCQNMTDDCPDIVHVAFCINVMLHQEDQD